MYVTKASARKQLKETLRGYKLQGKLKTCQEM